MIFVTGATGRIGRFVQHLVRREGAVDLCFLTRRAVPVADGLHWRLWDGDAAFAGARTVLHLAGATPTTGAAFDAAAYTTINVDLALAVAEAAARTGAGRVLFASSASVYGHPPTDDHVFTEDDTPVPLNDYARSKVRMERAVLDGAMAGTAASVLRIATIAGADALLQNALAATEHAPLTLDRFASGQGPLRSYIGPETLAQALLALARHPADLPPILNVAAAPPVRMENLLQVLARHRPVHWRFRTAPDSAIEKVVLETSAFERLCPSRPAGEMCDSLISEMRAFIEPG